MNTLLERLKGSLDAAMRDMSEDQLAWHPVNKWSTAEVMEHLYLSYTGTIRGMEKMLQGGAPATTHPTMRHRARNFVVFSLNYLPSGREAPATTRPKGLPIEKVKREYAEKLQAMDAIISQCEDRFGRNVRLMDHPILGPLTARQWRKFHLIHGLHHRKQILRLREAMAQSR